MNYMKQVAEMLGVELGEEFKTKYSSFKYKLTERGLLYSHDDEWNFDSSVLRQLLCSNLEIIKLQKPILDDIEKDYLNAVIEPFRESIVSITKYHYNYYEDCIYLSYECKDENLDSFRLPRFDTDTMYKGMEYDKKYSLEELGL